jgi:hypothetical protein
MSRFLDKVEYRFYEAFMQPSLPITPAPIVDHFRFQKQNIIEIYGLNFTPNTKVWFADICGITAYRSERLLCVTIPPYNTVLNHPIYQSTNGRMELPILLVRSDGLIFNTGKRFVYQCDTPPNPEYPQSLQNPQGFAYSHVP